VALTAVKGGDSEQAHIELGESGGYEVVENWDLADLCAEKARVLGKILEEAGRAPKGKVDIILGSEVAGLSVHESVGHPYEADRILGREVAQAGESFVSADMLGTRIGSELVTVVDDPTIERSYGFYLYDEEGVRARPRYLMREGIIAEFLHNRETAAALGVNSNGASRASRFDREPLVRMASTYMMPGDSTLDELIEDVELGVYVKTYGEWNIDDLRYNMRFVGGEAYRIEKGVMKGLIRKPIIELTTPKFYSSIDGLTKEVEHYAGLCGKGDPEQGIPVWFGGPTVRLRGVRLGGYS
jgi:TldD protein